MNQKLIESGSFGFSQPEELQAEVLFTDPPHCREVDSQRARPVRQPQSKLYIAPLKDDPVAFDGTAVPRDVADKPLADEGHSGKHHRAQDREAVPGSLKVEFRNDSVADCVRRRGKGVR